MSKEGIITEGEDLGDPGEYFRDFTCTELLDWVYVDESELISLEKDFLEGLIQSLEEDENYELCACVKKHLDTIDKYKK